MSFQLKRVLISDAVDQSAVDILKQKNIETDIKTGLPKDQLIQTIRVCIQTKVF